MSAIQPTPMRRERERDLVRATRRLFDERGMLDAPIEEIARAAGIARGLIYRQFSSKEELVILTVTDYLAELETDLASAVDIGADPAARLERGLRAYTMFCARYPAFVDVSLSLMRRPASELRAVVSPSVWLRLGQRMAASIDRLTRVLREGAADGTFEAEDPEYVASILWTQVLGAIHLARLGAGVAQTAPGVPHLFSIDAERVIETCVTSALATVGVRGR